MAAFWADLGVISPVHLAYEIVSVGFPARLFNLLIRRIELAEPHTEIVMLFWVSEKDSTQIEKISLIYFSRIDAANSTGS